MSWNRIHDTLMQWVWSLGIIFDRQEDEEASKCLTGRVNCCAKNQDQFQTVFFRDFKSSNDSYWPPSVFILKPFDSFERFCNPGRKTAEKWIFKWKIQKTFWPTWKSTPWTQSVCCVQLTSLQPLDQRGSAYKWYGHCSVLTTYGSRQEVCNKSKKL